MEVQVNTQTKLTSGKDETIGTDATVKARFLQLDGKRQGHLERARQCAALTIPSLLPPEGTTENDLLPTPFQGLGARAVNNLAAKLLLTILPPNTPFFRMGIDDSLKEQVAAELGMPVGELNAAMEEGFAVREKQTQEWVEAEAYRVPVFRGLKLLLVTGNILKYMPDKGGMRIYRLDQFVSRRDPIGNTVEMITKDLVNPDSLQDLEFKARVLSKKVQDPKYKDKETVELYTHILRDGNKWKVRQEVAGLEVPDSEGTYPINNCPWNAIRLIPCEGENYGRGYVEEHLGDLISLESLMKDIVEGSAAAAKVLFLVNPNGITDIRDLVNAPNAGFASGVVEDVQCLQVGKHNDLQIPFQTMGELRMRLEQAFLLNSSIQRNGERVTAEEIRYMASELEDALGGIYSSLSLELQKPFLYRVIAQMKHAKKFPAGLPVDVMKLTITTGLEALGRGHDLSKLQNFMENLSVLGPELIGQYMNVGNYISRVGTSLGIDIAGLIKTDEQLQAEAAQVKQDAMVNGVMDAAAKALPGMGTEVVKGAMAQIPTQQG